MRKVLVCLCILVLGFVSSVSAQPLLGCAAETHIERKGTYLNGTTGFFDDGVWEWIIGSGDTYTNIQCVTALGLFHAAYPTGNPAFALAAFDTVNLTVGRYNDDLVVRPYAQDVDIMMDACEFDPLGMLMETPEDTPYCAIATSLYGRVVGDFPSPSANVSRHITNRASLAGWDVAWHIRASWRSGWLTYSLGMIDQVFDRRAEWEHVPYGGSDYTNLSWGALTWVVFQMHNDGLISNTTYNKALLMAQDLITAQDPGGSWEYDVQTTSYALLGLRANEAYIQTWHAPILGAFSYITNASIPGGCSWATEDELVDYGEVDSEAMMALALYETLPFVDGFESGNDWAWSGSQGIYGRPARPKTLYLGNKPHAEPVR